MSNPMTESLRRLKIFAACSTKDLEAVARMSTTLDYPAGKVLATEGRAGSGVRRDPGRHGDGHPRRHRAR